MASGKLCTDQCLSETDETLVQLSEITNPLLVFSRNKCSENFVSVDNRIQPPTDVPPDLSSTLV